MVVIRDQQLQSLMRDVGERFALSLRDHVRARLPHLAEGLADEELTRRIEDALSRGGALALHGEALTFYVLLALDLGPEFDRHPAFHDILADVRRPPELRLALLRTVITASDLEEARSRPS